MWKMALKIHVTILFTLGVIILKSAVVAGCNYRRMRSYHELMGAKQLTDGTFMNSGFFTFSFDTNQMETENEGEGKEIITKDDKNQESEADYRHIPIKKGHAAFSSFYKMLGKTDGGLTELSYALERMGKDLEKLSKKLRKISETSQGWTDETLQECGKAFQETFTTSDCLLYWNDIRSEKERQGTSTMFRTS